MLPGKTYGPDDIVRLLSRRWWMLAIPLVIGALGALAYAKRLPNQYMSETLIMVVPQRIPDSYVKTPVTTRIEDRLATLRDQILSRSRLERIILDLNLYQVQRRVGTMEDVVQRMRNEIDVRVEGKESFRVTYVSGTPESAQQVAQRLASLFIEENLKDRENVAEDTNRFLDAELEDARRRLIEQEKKLEAYQRRYSGQLPSQAQSNQQTIQNAEIQRQTLSQAADRERERRIQFERQLAELQLGDPVAVGVPAPAPVEMPGTLSSGTTAQQLDAARAGLEVLRLKNTPDHPDVRIMERRVRDLEAKLKAEGPSAATPSVSPTEVLRQRRIRDVNAQIAAVDRQLKEYEQEDQRLRGVIGSYQAKVAAVPTRESELVEINRDYETLKATYNSLLAKREESKLAANLERRNIGEQFRILDPARVPEGPFSPNRRLLTLIGAAAGLGLGLMVLGGLELRDSSFATEDDLSRLISIPVLAVVPLMMSDAERRVQRRRKVGLIVAGVVLASIAAIVVWQLPS